MIKPTNAHRTSARRQDCDRVVGLSWSKRNFWTAATLRQDSAWIFNVDGLIDLGDDLDTLERWALARCDPVTDYLRGALRLPAIAALAGLVRREMRYGSGIARVLGLDPSLNDTVMRLVFLSTGSYIGAEQHADGRLYDIRDRSNDYGTGEVPLLLTNMSTGFETDGSARRCAPDYVGHLCLRPAECGGEAVVTSAVSAHEVLRRTHPDMLRLLYCDFIHASRIVNRRNNTSDDAEFCCAIYGVDALYGELTLRYSRAEMEWAGRVVGKSLETDLVQALDAFDCVLQDPSLAYSVPLRRGEMLWLNNRTIAHNRRAFSDNPASPRQMARLWLLDREMHV